MLRRILDESRRALVRDLRGQLDQLRVVLVRGGAAEEDQKALARSIAQLDELFLLVVAGEFNAGKSAVINALLGESVVEEGVTPTTSRIQVLKHGGERRRTPTGGGFEEITLPVSILREMNVVDTPGTNAVIEGHEALTREFVPRSDLVLFVTSADRPFTASERAFLEAIRDWGKKVVVAVNKTDILDRTEDVEKVVGFVRDKMRALLGLKPEVFAVSARRAQKLKAAGVAPDPRADGFGALESYVTRTLDDAERLRLKLQNPLGVAAHVLDRSRTGVGQRLSVLEKDVALLKEIEGQCGRHGEDLGRELRIRLADVEKPLVDFQRRGEEFVEERLVLAALPLLLGERSTARRFEERVAPGLGQSLDKRVDGLVDVAVATEAQLWSAIAGPLHECWSRYARQLRGSPPAATSPDRGRLRDALRRETRRALDGADAEGLRVAGVANKAAIGTGLVALAALLTGAGAVAAGAEGPALAGGLGGAAALMAVALWLFPAVRRRERSRLADRAGEIRQKLGSGLRSAFEREADAARRRVREAVAPLDALVRGEGERLRAYEKELADVGGKLDAFRSRVETLR